MAHSSGNCSSRIGFLLVTLAVAAAPSGVLAHTGVTRFFEVDAQLAESGPIDRVDGLLLLRSLIEDEELAVGLWPEEEALPPVGSSIELEALVPIEPGGEVELEFSVQLSEEPKQQKLLYLIVIDKWNLTVGYQVVDLYFRVEGGVYRRSSYEELYVPETSEVDWPDEERLVLAAIEVPEEDEYLVPDTELFTHDEYPLELHELPEPGEVILSAGEREPDGAAWNPIPEETTATSRSRAATATPSGIVFADRRPSGLRGSPTAPRYRLAAQARPFTVRGRFSYKGIDKKWQSAWNWWVELSWRSPSGTRVLGGTWVRADGTWSVTVADAGYSGQNLQVAYRAGNYYVMPQNRNGRQYWWANRPRSNIASSLDIGHWGADTSSTGTLLGLGDVYRNGELFWWKLHSNRMNPVRASPIRLFFPNTWDNCGLTSPWSCASPGGDVWLIPAHTVPFIIQHELAHQLNFEFWNNALPPASTGRHSASRCYTRGLALIEGFANVLPYWVMKGEKANSPWMSWGGPIETAPGGTCKGETNETRVAGTLWDLMDLRNDGTDRMHFSKAADVISIYLRGGVRGGIVDYAPDYRNRLPTADRFAINEVFKQNTIRIVSNGYRCSSHSDCSSAYCADEARCAPQDGTGAPGDYCHHNNHCASGTCVCPQGRNIWGLCNGFATWSEIQVSQSYRHRASFFCQ